MFFVDARELGDHFFQAGDHPNIRLVGGIPIDEILDPASEYDRSGNTYLFASWVNDAVLPGFRESNPQRTDGASTNILITQGQTDTEIHRDKILPSTDVRSFLTLGVLPDGTTAGTMFPNEDVAVALQQRLNFTVSLTNDYLATHFSNPPDRYAAVFDPDLEVHAGPPVVGRRILYKAIVSKLLTSGTNGDVPLHPLVEPPTSKLEI